MYNRYICNDQGSYTRICEEDAPCPQESHAQQHTSSRESSGRQQTSPPSDCRGGDSVTAFLRRTLDQLHLDSIDAGDLLLLGLLFFLYRENADEELLMALGLLLIL